MKDLYTFDYSPALALSTYHQVRDAYAKLFDELKLPYLVAEADSGDIGGDLSHEFHFPTSKGEDHIISCTTCDYVANEELAESPILTTSEESSSTINEDQHAHTLEPTDSLRVWRGVSKDRLTLVNVWYFSPNDESQAGSQLPSTAEVNTHMVKAILPEFDPSVVDPLHMWNQTPGEGMNASVPQKIVNLVDGHLPSSVMAKLTSPNTEAQMWPPSLKTGSDAKIETIEKHPETGHPLNLLRIKTGDSCPRCSDGSLQVQKAIELGHTFHLGTRYSEPMNANVMVPSDILGDAVDSKLPTSSQAITQTSSRQVAMQMGCHGIGVSRIIGAVADTLADEKGLNWPRVMAPFEVAIVPAKKTDEGTEEVYDILSQTGANVDTVDVVLDDRKESFAWKMRDADLVGYPVIVVVGRRWKSDRICEVQCRRLKIREEMPVDNLLNFVKSLLEKI